MSFLLPNPRFSRFHNPDELLGREKRDELRRQEAKTNLLISSVFKTAKQYALNNPDSLVQQIMDGMELTRQFTDFDKPVPEYEELLLGSTEDYIADYGVVYPGKFKPQELAEAFPETGDFFLALDKELTLPAAAFIFGERAQKEEFARVMQEYDRRGVGMLSGERISAFGAELGYNLIDPTNWLTAGIASAAVRGGLKVAGSNLVGRFANTFVGRGAVNIAEDLGDFAIAQTAIELGNIYRSQEVGSGRDWLMGMTAALTFGVGQRSIATGARKILGYSPRPYLTQEEFETAFNISSDPTLSVNEKRALLERVIEGSATEVERNKFYQFRAESLTKIKQGKAKNIDFEVVAGSDPSLNEPSVRAADQHRRGINQYEQREAVEFEGLLLPGPMPPADKQFVANIQKQREDMFSAAAIDHPILEKLGYMKTLFNRDVVIVPEKLFRAEMGDEVIITRGRTYDDRPGTIYINEALTRGPLGGKELNFVLGHELFHTIARSNPKLARELEGIMVESGLAKNMAEEDIADVFGEAFESDAFWKALQEARYSKVRQAFVKFWNFLTGQLDKFPELKELHTKLGKRVGEEKKFFRKAKPEEPAFSVLYRTFEPDELTAEQMSAAKPPEEPLTREQAQGEQIREALKGPGYKNSSFQANKPTVFETRLRRLEEDIERIIDPFEEIEGPRSLTEIDSAEVLDEIDPAVRKTYFKYANFRNLAIKNFKNFTTEAGFMKAIHKERKKFFELQEKQKVQEITADDLKEVMPIEISSALVDMYRNNIPITIDSLNDRFESMFRRDVLQEKSAERASLKVSQLGTQEKIYQWMVGGWSGDQTPGIGNSVSRDKVTYATGRSSLLAEVLDKVGKRDEFFDKDHAFPREVAKELAGVGTEDAAAKEVAGVIAKLYEANGKSLMNHGAITDLRQNMVLKVRHTQDALKKAGKEQWVADMMEWVDPEKMKRYLDVGNREKMEGYLRGVYDNLIENDYTEPLVQQEYVNEFSKQLAKRKLLLFKNEFEYDYDLKYGSGNPGKQILNQIHKAAEAEVILNNFGPSVEKIREKIIGDKQRLFANPNKFRKRWLNKVVFDQIVGDLDHPANKPGATTIHNMTKKVNQITDFAILELAGVSAPFYDLPSMVTQMNVLGMPMDRAYREMVQLYKDNIAPKLLNKGEEKQLLHVMGAAADAKIFSAGRFGSEMNTGQGKMDDAHRKFFEITQLQKMTELHQETIHDMMQQWVGEIAYSARIGAPVPEQALNALRRFDITLDELAEAGKYTTKEQGLTGFRIHPVDIDSPELRRKLGNYFDEAMRTGVLEPDEASLAIGKLGLQAGTPAGAAVRILGKFRAWEMASYRQSFKRNFKAFGHEKLTDFIMRPTAGSSMALMASLGAFSFSAFSAAFMKMMVVETLRGNDPVDVAFNGGNLLRVIENSGVLPILPSIVEGATDMIAGSTMKAVMGQAGPFVNLADRPAEELYNIFFNETDFSSYKAISGVADFIPGSDLPVLNKGFEALLSGIFGDYYYSGYVENEYWKDIMTEAGSILK